MDCSTPVLGYLWLKTVSRIPRGCFHILVGETSQGFTASILAVRTRSWGLVAEPIGHRVGIKSLVWWDWFTKQLDSVLKLMLVCWFIGPEPSRSTGQILACLWASSIHRLKHYSFLATVVYSLTGKPGPEARAGLLEYKARTQAF